MYVREITALRLD